MYSMTGGKKDRVRLKNQSAEEYDYEISDLLHTF